ncbi:MAG: glycosyltransferase [Proteobacteria bacterium]|nr:MAG: glycosyltransferase [Pseudomonadota bacterium]
MLNVLIVSVAYNPPTTILKNLEADYYPHLVIDNSEQETVWLKEYCLLHDHIYQWMGDNVGIAKALNVGASYAMQHGFDYIVTMDQDSELTNQLLQELTSFIIDYGVCNDVAIFSPRHKIGNNSIEYNLAIEDNILLPMTSGNFVNLKIWYKLLGFDENLFIDAVDIDYYAKAKISGYRILTLNYVVMPHCMGTHSGVMWIFKYGFDVWNHSALRKYYIMRNYNYICKKYLSKLPELYFFKKIIIKMPISVVLFEKGKFKKLYYLLQGYIDFRLGVMGKKKW